MRLTAAGVAVAGLPRWLRAECAAGPPILDRTDLNRALRGFGLGLRPQHYEAILATEAAVDWFEILSENDLVEGGRPLGQPLLLENVSSDLRCADNTFSEWEFLAALAAFEWA